MWVHVHTYVQRQITNSEPPNVWKTFPHTSMHPEKALSTCVERCPAQTQLAVHTHVFTSGVKAFLLLP